MSDTKIRVLGNGYGVIGKRVADVVAVQDDMQLVGVADVVSDWRIKVAVEKGYPIYASTQEAADGMRAAGIPVQGDLHELLERVDVVADCTPKGIGAKNLEHYREHDVKAIFQGGEKHSLTGYSFVVQSNNESAMGRDAARVNSCNNTSIVRTPEAQTVDPELDVVSIAVRRHRSNQV